MLEFTDQIGNTIKLDRRPTRVISIVPSQSEFLWELGLHSELVGITKFCKHPDVMYKSIDRVGGTKKLDLEKIRRLKPDLIIGNREENEKTQIEELQKEFNVWMSDIYSFDDAFEMMIELGRIFGKENESGKIVTEIKSSLADIKNIFNGERTAYFIWKDPFMFAAKNTFIDHVLNYTGLTNALSEYERYPRLDEAALKNLDPEFCFLSSEPYPFKERHIRDLQKILPASKIMIVDGEVFSWYGTRLLHLAEYVKLLKFKIGQIGGIRKK